MGNWGAKLVRLAVVFIAASFLWACEGDDGKDGATGPQGPTGPTGPAGPAGPPASTAIQIGDGSALTAEDIDELGKLQATITGVTVTSPPVVDFTVLDRHGNPAVGLDAGAVRFTFAKLVPNGDPVENGGLPYWQNYLYTSEDPDQPTGPNVLAFGGRGGTESGGTLEEIADGQYRYTFATDVTNVTDPVAVPWEPNLTHRVGMEIRLGGDARRPMAPDNPIYDFVPDGGMGSGVTKNIADTLNCNACHFEFAEHGGQRKSVEYCVTCHNHGMVDADSGNSLDMAYMAHSIHRGADRPVPYIIYRRFGGNDRTFDFSDIHFPQSVTYCETCHAASETHPDGDNWNELGNVKACGGCHADGVVAENFDAVTGVAEYSFDHTVSSDVPGIGVQADGSCGGCHFGNIPVAGPPLAIHSKIAGDQRFREELGNLFDFEIIEALNTGPGQTPVITFKVSRPDGTAYDIVGDPEFDLSILDSRGRSVAALNLYVAWTTDDIYNGDELGATGSLRCTDRSDPADGIPDVVAYSTAHPHRMYLDCLQYTILNDEGSMQNEDGSFTVTYFTSLPENITGDVMVSLGGHPVVDYVANNDRELLPERAAATSAVFFPGAERQPAYTSENCNACHKHFQFHGSNRNGNLLMCLNCHNADLANGSEGFNFSRLIHSIHIASESFNGGEFSGVHFPQNPANCSTCHVEGRYNVARTTARAISLTRGEDSASWLDDVATTPTAAACGTCHTSVAAMGHFNSQGGQVAVPKDQVVKIDGLPNGQEACAVCHGPGSEFDTTKYHNPGVE